MDPRSPQNIEAFLQQLKTTVDQTNDFSENEHVVADEGLSDVQMQEELKKKYFGAFAAYDSPEEEDSYALDDDFLRELNRASSKKHASLRASVPTAPEEPIVEELIVEEPVMEESTEEATEEITEEPMVEDMLSDDRFGDLPPWEDPVEERIVDEEPIEEELIEEELIEEELIEEELIDEELIDEEPIEEERIEEELIEEEPIEEEPIEEESIDEEIIDEEIIDEEFMLVQSLAEDVPDLEEPIEETLIQEPVMHTMNIFKLGVYGKNPDPVQEETPVAPAEAECLPDEATDDIDLMFETSVPQKRDADPSIVDLLLQFGCEDELEQTVEEERISEYFCAEGSDVPCDPTASYAYDGNEYASAEQNEALQQTYHRAFLSSLYRMIGVAALTVLMLLYDCLPLLGVELSGIFDYQTYPVAYVLLGLQLLLICCLPVLKNLWRGACSLWKFRIEPYTVAAASVIAVAMYDLSVLAMANRMLPPLFHFVAVFAVLAAAVSDHLLLCREYSTFRVYSAEGMAYTLLQSSGKGSVAETMRRGGLPKHHTVRVPADVSFPNCYFRSVCEDTQAHSAMRFLLVPTVLVSILCSVLSMFLGNSLFASLSLIFILLLAALPSSAILVDSVILYVATAKLERKGCAIAGKGAIARYADTNVLVFRDRHLFAPCRSEDVGIVLYDEEHAGKALSCLKALYDRVDGPMASVLGRIPSEYSAEDVKIVRMFRNGIESVIAKKHVLIVGDLAFMERYGFDFADADGDPASGGRATLCVSLDGVMSAKLNVKYALEPLFEVLVERLAKDQIYCAVETQDPLIHSRMAAALRKRGRTPISIVHKTARDAQGAGRTDSEIRKEPTGILARRSRLHLCEVAILCKRLHVIRRRIAIGTVIGAMATFVLAVTLFLTGGWASQYIIWLCHAVLSGLLLVAGLGYLPPRGYMSLVAYDREQQR